MFRPTISAIIRRFYDDIKYKLRKRTILYTTIQPGIIILLYHKRHNKIFEPLQCIKLNSNVQYSPLPHFTFYVVVKSPDDGRNCRPKHVAYVRKKLMLEYLFCCIGQITKENVKYILISTNTKTMFQILMVSWG